MDRGRSPKKAYPPSRPVTRSRTREGERDGEEEVLHGIGPIGEADLQAAGSSQERQDLQVDLNLAGEGPEGAPDQDFVIPPPPVVAEDSVRRESVADSPIRAHLDVENILDPERGVAGLGGRADSLNRHPVDEPHRGVRPSEGEVTVKIIFSIKNNYLE